MISFHRSSKGFTLVEIMIVVAIVALLAAIAIPNLLRARHNANEAAAIGALRTLSTSLESYRSAQSPTGYPTSMTALSSSSPPYCDTTLTTTSTSSTRQGYYFQYQRRNTNQFDLWAEPYPRGTSGTRGFFVDERGVLRVNASARAYRTSPALE